MQWYVEWDERNQQRIDEQNADKKPKKISGTMFGTGNKETRDRHNTNEDDKTWEIHEDDISRV